MAISINEVKNLVDYITRKNNSGALNPDQFNLIIHRAQMTKFMELYGNPLDYQLDKADTKISYDVTQKISDDLRVFKKQTSIILANEGRASLPLDYVHLITLRYIAGTNTNGTAVREYIEIKIIPEDNEFYRLGSKIVPPSKKFPIAVLKSNYLQVYPTNISTVNLSYLSQPPQPVWGYNIVNGRPVFDATKSVNLLWTDVCINDIVIRAMSYVGISIKDNDIIGYSQIKIKEGT